MMPIFTFKGTQRVYRAYYEDVSIEAPDWDTAFDKLEEVSAEMCDLGLECVDFTYESFVEREAVDADPV